MARVRTKRRSPFLAESSVVELWFALLARALVVFPEGGNWTPYRGQRAIDRLRRGGRPDLAERAATMPNVLPPHGSGTLAVPTSVSSVRLTGWPGGQAR